MFDPSIVVAQSESAAASAASGESFFARLNTVYSGTLEHLDILNRPEDLVDVLGQLHFSLAGVLMVVGVLCVLNGYRWHRWVIVICAFLCGFGLGWLMSRQMDQPYLVSGALAFMSAVIATPLLRVSVAFFGALTGAFVGANVWTAFGYPPETLWAGAIIGLVVVGMASFMMFKHVVVLFTSVGGSAMAICGAIALLLYVPEWRDSVAQSLASNQTLIPLLVATAAVIGLVLQEGQKAPADDAGE